MSKKPEYGYAKKSGRAFNGAHRDSGSVVHIVPKLPKGTGGDWFDKAVCGTEPGRRGNGWHEVNEDPTCERCIKKFDK